MNKLILIAVSLVLTVGTFGCKTAPKSPEAIAYLTLADIQNAVDKALTVYGALSFEGKVSPADEARVAGAYERYQTAMLAAIRAARYDWTSPSPEGLIRLKNEIFEIVTSL
jgi:hypothetical protein